MRLGRSWDVPDEFWMLWWRRRQLRLIMQVDVEPAGKGPLAGGLHLNSSGRLWTRWSATAGIQ
jgi:hypothetical protein